MMTKTTSKFSGFIKKAGIIPLLTFMIYFLCIDIVAQEKKTIETNFPNEELDAYYGDTRVVIKDKNGKIITDKKYTELSEEEKMRVPPPPPKPAKSLISETQFEDFKNQAKYAIWIDGNHLKNTELNKYKASDFVFYINNHVYKNARSQKFPQENQLWLYTEKGYTENYEKIGGTIELTEDFKLLNKRLLDAETIEIGKIIDGLEKDEFMLDNQKFVYKKSNDLFYRDNEQINLKDILFSTGTILLNKKVYTYKFSNNDIKVYKYNAKYSESITAFFK